MCNVFSVHFLNRFPKASIYEQIIRFIDLCGFHLNKSFVLSSFLQQCR